MTETFDAGRREGWRAGWEAARDVARTGRKSAAGRAARAGLRALPVITLIVAAVSGIGRILAAHKTAAAGFATTLMMATSVTAIVLVPSQTHAVTAPRPAGVSVAQPAPAPPAPIAAHRRLKARSIRHHLPLPATPRPVPRHPLSRRKPLLALSAKAVMLTSQGTGYVTLTATGGPVGWSASVLGPWVKLDTSLGTVTPGSPVTIGIRIRGRLPASGTTTITFQWPGGTADVTVTWVAAQPSPQASPAR